MLCKKDGVIKMAKKTSKPKLIPLLRESVFTFVEHPIILFPFITVAFIQLLALEILYFSTRPPLSVFFAPLIERMWGEGFLHYPNNFLILPKLFQYAQIAIYLLFGGFFISTAIKMIGDINAERKACFTSACKYALGRYVHIFIATVISFGAFYGFYRLYNLAFERAVMIRSKAGIFFMLKVFVISGAPYFNLLIGVFTTALFAFLFPIIVLDKRKVFSAFFLNFVHLWRSFWFVFFVVLVPTVCYVPVLLLRNNVAVISDATFEGTRLLVIVLSVFIMIFIDASVYTAITTYYLLKKEN